MVLVSLVFELQGTYVLLNEKTRKVHALLLNFTLLKLCLGLSNFLIYSMDFLYINCTNYLQCLSYPISSLLWLTPLILAALFVLTAPSRMHQRLTGIMTRTMRSPWQLCHHLSLSTWFKLLCQRGSILFLNGKLLLLSLLPVHVVLTEPCAHLNVGRNFRMDQCAATMWRGLGIGSSFFVVPSNFPFIAKCLPVVLFFLAMCELLLLIPRTRVFLVVSSFLMDIQ